MQSANGEVDQLLGLVCNVPFRIGPITLFLQAHMLHTPRLSGLDPNSGMMAMIPTIERGKGKRKIVPSEINLWKASWQEAELQWPWSMTQGAEILEWFH
jgi:hypothetical protein